MERFSWTFSEPWKTTTCKVGVGVGLCGEDNNIVADVPYHNSVHAADVTQSTHVLLNSPALEVKTWL